MGRNFSEAMLYLIRWSFFQPKKLTAYMSTLHPDLASHTGFIQQVWLAGRSAAVRRFLSLQFGVWLIAGLLSFLIMVITHLATSPNRSLFFVPDMTFPSELLYAEAAFGIIGTLIVGIALSIVGGVAVGISGSLVAALLLGLSLGLSFGLAGGATAGVALGFTGGVILGSIGSIFDHLHRPRQTLSTVGYWGRATIGFIFTAMSTVLFGLALVLLITVADVFVNDLLPRLILGAVAGMVAGLILILGMILGMRFEIGYVDRRRLKWHILDILFLGIVGGAAGGYVISAAAGIWGALTLIILWGVLIGCGGGLAMHVGNGISATLAAAGLTWLLVAGIDNPFVTTALIAVGTTLLTGLFTYVRLPICMIEVPLTRLQYLLTLWHPQEATIRLRHTPVYWDDLIFYPLPALDQFLLMLLRADRTQGLQEISFMAQSFRQVWAANRARLAFAIETVAKCTSSQLIAQAPAELDWLADEALPTLPYHSGEIIPRLLGIAGGVQTTLNADNAYSRRLGYRDALDGLDTLQRRLLSLGQQAVDRWQPVLSQWQKVLLNELETSDTLAAPAEATENPYQPGNPLQLNRKELFKGRRGLRDTVVNALLERHRPTLVLHGPRRMGKTSFLLQLPALLPGNTLPVFLDLQRPTTTQNTAAFFYSIARAISRDARPYRLLLDAPPRNRFQESPFEAFAEWLEDVALPALQDFNLLLTFDEFEKLGEAVTAQRLDARVFDELRYLIQHQTQLALLFAGVQTLDELGPTWSSYFINIKPLTIDYLRPEQAEALIRQPDSGANFNLRYKSAIVAEIVAETKCHPYLLQLLCSTIVEESNTQNTLEVNGTILEAAIERALEQGEPYFRNIWDEMAGSDGQPFLAQLAQSEIALSNSDNPALTRLLRRRIITKRDTGYDIEVPLVRRWVRERAPTL